MEEVLIFKDFGFKLLVINELMYHQNVLPRFDLDKFVEAYTEREIDIEEEGYDIIPEVAAYFKDLEILTGMVQNITELEQDGGDEIYHEICPFWDGEDASFDIKSAEDVHLLPNLKKMTLILTGDDVIDAFNEKGIETDWL